jgi:uncharacterized protein YyaL (SSP411 family)
MSDTIRWQHFDPATLRQAAESDRPILLLLVAPWCQHCRTLQQTTFADPQVIALVRDGFVPVLVDAERRPDVNQRFGTGAWPTIAWLTPDGELLAHDGFLTADALRTRLERVRTAWRHEKEQIRAGLRDLWAQHDDHGDPAAGRRAPTGRLRRDMVDEIALAIYEKLDHRHGGFGEGSKFPHPEAIDFALVQVSKRRDERMREVVVRTLDAMLHSPMQDRVEGGFFRFSKTADWHTPNHEKLLDQNALVLRAYLEAYQVFGEPLYRRAAAGIVDWLLGRMLDPATGAFAGSQDADSDYYQGDRTARAQRQAPSLDRTVYCHANAIAASSLWKAAAVLERPELAAVASRTLQFLVDHLYDGRDVFHYWDGTYHLPGLLVDQAYLIRALIDASQNTGDADLLLPAEAIAERAIERHKAPHGGFYDILPNTSQPGPMARRNRSILDNATMAESLVRLGYLSRRPEFHAEAVKALDAFADGYKEYGYYVASYGRAVDLIFYEPLFVTIVGDRDAAATTALRRAALSVYVPSRIVQTLDPRRDPVLLGRSGLPAEAEPVVYFHVGRRQEAIARSPAEVLAAIERIELARRATA